MVGGIFTEFVSWRWIFWINPLLVLIICAIVATKWEQPNTERMPGKFDYSGFCALAIGLGMAVLAIMQGPEWGWTHPAVIGFGLGGICALVLFVVIETRIATPLIELDLLKNKVVAISNLTIFTAQYTKVSVIIFGALYLQQVVNMSPFITGLALMAAVIPNPFIAGSVGKLADRYQPRPIMASGLLAAGCGLLWIGLRVNADNYWLILPPLILWGSAMPALFVPSLSSVMNAVPLEKQGLAGGINNTSQLVGGTISMAIGSTVYLVTDSYEAVFLSTAGLCFTVLLLVLIGMAKTDLIPIHTDRSCKWRQVRYSG